MVEVSFVIPCLNESRTIKNVINTCHKAGSYFDSYEIIIADNNSTDNSKEIALSQNAKVIDVKQKGYGSALKKGIESSKGKYIVMGDGDNTYDFMDSINMIKILRNNKTDLVIGDRFSGRIQKGAMPKLHRYLGNPFLTMIGKILYLVDINDFHCGIRAFKRQSIIDLRLKTIGMEYASEMIIRSSLAGYSIAQVPVTLKKNIPMRIPHIKTWRDGWRHLKFLFNFSPKYSYFPMSIIFILISFLLSFFYLNDYDPFAGSNTLLFSAVFYNFSLWTFSEYITCRLLISKEIKYKTNSLSEYLFKRISRYEYIDKAYQIIFILIIIFIFQSIYIFNKLNIEMNFLKSKIGNLCSFNLILITSTVIFLYLTSSKLGTIYWLKNKDKN